MLVRLTNLLFENDFIFYVSGVLVAWGSFPAVSWALPFAIIRLVRMEEHPRSTWKKATLVLARNMVIGDLSTMLFAWWVIMRVLEGDVPTFPHGELEEGLDMTSSATWESWARLTFKWWLVVVLFLLGDSQNSWWRAILRSIVWFIIDALGTLATLLYCLYLCGFVVFAEFGFYYNPVVMGKLQQLMRKRIATLGTV